MRITHHKGVISLDQKDYLITVLKCFNMQNVKEASTSLPSGYNPVPNTLPVDEKLCTKYLQVIGSLLYLMLGTRPDIAYAVTKMAQFAANLSEEHLTKALYICKYLAGITNYKLKYGLKQQCYIYRLCLPLWTYLLADKWLIVRKHLRTSLGTPLCILFRLLLTY